MKTALVLIAKSPVLHHPKTRLAAKTSPQHSLQLHLACIKDHLSFFQTLPCPWVVYVGTPHSQTFDDVFPKNNTCYVNNPTLAQIMTQAQEDLFKKHEALIFVGLDAYFALRKTLPLFLTSQAPMLGPTYDGGIYALKLFKPQSIDFKSIPFGTSTVFHTLMRALEPYAPIVTPKHLDLDELADVPKALQELQSLNEPLFTLSVLEEIQTLFA